MTTTTEKPFNTQFSTIREWLEDEVKEKNEEGYTTFLNDLTKHGCISGMVSSLIYYEDTNAFYDQFESEIWEMLEESAQDQGINILELIGHFKGADNVEDMSTFKNLLAWYACEETAHKMLMEKEESDNA